METGHSLANPSADDRLIRSICKVVNGKLAFLECTEGQLYSIVKHESGQSKRGRKREQKIYTSKGTNRANQERKQRKPDTGEK